MEPEVLKFRLRTNYNSVVKDIEPKKLLGYLYQEGIFDEDEMDEVRDERTRKKQAVAMLSLLSRKPEGYQVLVESLKEAQPHLARLLQTPIEGENIRNAPRENHYSEEIIGIMEKLRTTPTENHHAPTFVFDSGSIVQTSNPNPCLIKGAKNGAKAISPTNLKLISPLYGPYNLESVYKMTSSPRGRALIININDFDSAQTSTGKELPKRDGSIVDEKALSDLFTDLDFKTEALPDQNEDELIKNLEQISKSDFSQYDCFVLCIMSHGEEGFFYTRDGGTITIKFILEKFNNANCRTLCGKPKLYFVQACRGKKSDRGTIVKDAPSSTPTENEEPHKTPEKPQYGLNWKPPKGMPSTGEHADQLVAFSSVEGYSSYRHTSAGSRFIRSLVEVFRRYAGMEDVESMMTRVINKVNSQGELESKQVPKPETTLTKKVFFWPGMKFER